MAVKMAIPPHFSVNFACPANVLWRPEAVFLRVPGIPVSRSMGWPDRWMRFGGQGGGGGCLTAPAPTVSFGATLAICGGNRGNQGYR